MRPLSLLALCLIATGCATARGLLDEPGELAEAVGTRLHETARDASNAVEAKVAPEAPVAAPAKVSAAEAMSQTDDTFNQTFGESSAPAKAAPRPASKAARPTKAKAKGKLQWAKVGR
ncbi:MAG: hypothetical protein IPJ65_11730 [Archangiaceae bacterium]|nr:hypothetical protein [Archangiaceae bacterium]